MVQHTSGLNVYTSLKSLHLGLFAPLLTILFNGGCLPPVASTTGEGGAGATSSSTGATGGEGGQPACRAESTVEAAAPSGNVYYLDPAGNDNGPGTEEAPWRSIEKASNKMVAGDVALLKSGKYVGQVEIRVSGVFGAPITFAAAPGAEPIITALAAAKPHKDLIRIYGSHITLSGLIVENTFPGPGVGIFVNGAQWEPPGAEWVTLDGVEVRGAPGQGILMSGNNNAVLNSRIHDNGEYAQFDHGIYVEGACNVFRNNEVYKNWAFGIHLFGGEEGLAGHNRVERNFVYANGFGAESEAPTEPTSGIVVAWNHPSNVIVENVVCGNAKMGIFVRDGQPNTELTRNVTCYNGDSGLALFDPGAGTVLSENISYNDGLYALETVSGVTSDQNVFYKAGGEPEFLYNKSAVNFDALKAQSGQDKNSAVKDPEFTNVPADGFNPDAAGEYDFCTPLIGALCGG
ncbi:MAG: right-handed parallel beta-helix repeat-containing protein [Polyangiaceae bacterium]|nr:right-handed parallel beta-helix repeat-containing protein [Polyangiaceae bacterium]